MCLEEVDESLPSPLGAGTYMVEVLQGVSLCNWPVLPHLSLRLEWSDDLISTTVCMHIDIKYCDLWQCGVAMVAHLASASRRQAVQLGPSHYFQLQVARVPTG